MAKEDSSIQGFFEGLGENLLEDGASYVWDFFGKTKTGAKIETKLAGGVVSNYLSNPLVIVAIIIGVIFILKISKGR